MNAFWEGLITIVTAIIGLALIAVLVSNRANTASVVQAAASGLGNDIGVAISPVTGQKVSLSLGYPSDNSMSHSFGF